MPFSRHKSGLFVFTTGAQKPSCAYGLDERIDPELGAACQKIYRSIHSYLGDKVDIKVINHRGAIIEAFPDPIHAWVIYCAALIYGSADAALTLSSHNLGREARILARQIFEYVFKARYFATHPRVAKRELEAETFRDLWMLDELNYDRRRARYKRVKREFDALAKARPALYAYAKHTRSKEPPNVPLSMGRRSKRRKQTYALHYRLPSQTLHAGVLGMREIITGNGINFDSRERDANFTLLSIGRYLIVFLRILNDVFKLGRSNDIERDFHHVVQLERRLLAHLVRYAGSPDGDP